MGSLGTSIMEDLDTHPRTDALLRTTPSIAKSRIGVTSKQSSSNSRSERIELRS